MDAKLSRPANAGKRGPVRTLPDRRPTGYRIDDDTRDELDAARILDSAASLQAVLDLAVAAYLTKKRRDPRFQTVLDLIAAAKN